ncbi:hypothetical protein BRARA_C04551, partial [Brassica rapa]
VPSRDYRGPENTRPGRAFYFVSSHADILSFAPTRLQSFSLLCSFIITNETSISEKASPDAEKMHNITSH